MLWLILIVVCLIVLIVKFDDYYNSSLAVFCTVGAVIFGIVSVVIIICGVSEYPSFVGSKTEIESLQNQVEVIRNAYYKEDVPDNAVVGGNLTNMSQSSKLSEYLIDIAKKKSYYNKCLVKCRLYKSEFIYKYFTHGMFISKKIFELEEL